ncbi:MAG TPA: hypothetical protein VF502_19625 [Stellaceae bacterium]
MKALTPRTFAFPLGTSLALTLLLTPLAAQAQTDTSPEGQTIGQQRLASRPAPPGLQHWSFTVAGQYTNRQGETAGALPSLDIGYSVTPNLLIHLYQPYAFDRLSGGKTNFGPGDTEIGVRYRFIEPDDNGWRPGVVFYPLVDFPTGDRERGLGTGRTHFFLPLWLGKQLGAWTVYGGGGYWYNRGNGYKDWFFADAGVQYRVTDNLRFGPDVFHATSSKTGLKETTGVNVGGVYDFNANHHVLFSAGRGIQNTEETNRFSAYLGYQLTF